MPSVEFDNRSCDGDRSEILCEACYSECSLWNLTKVHEIVTDQRSFVKHFQRAISLSGVCAILKLPFIFIVSSKYTDFT